MDWRGRRAWPGRRSGNGSNGHRGRLIVGDISDEHSRYAVLLPAQKRKVNLPEIFKARGGKHRLHGFRLAAFPRDVVLDGNTRMKRVYEQLRIRRGLPVM